MESIMSDITRRAIRVGLKMSAGGTIEEQVEAIVVAMEIAMELNSPNGPVGAAVSAALPPPPQVAAHEVSPYAPEKIWDVTDGIGEFGRARGRSSTPPTPAKPSPIAEEGEISRSSGTRIEMLPAYRQEPGPLVGILNNTFPPYLDVLAEGRERPVRMFRNIKFSHGVGVSVCYEHPGLGAEYELREFLDFSVPEYWSGDVEKRLLQHGRRLLRPRPVTLTSATPFRQGEFSPGAVQGVEMNVDDLA